MQLRKINLCNEEKIFPDDVSTEKKSTEFSSSWRSQNFFENFLRSSLRTRMRACVLVRSSGGAVHGLNDGPRQIETAECRSN